MLNKFFTKYGLPFQKEQWQAIQKGDFDQLVSFMLSLYQFLTKRQ
jgi:hypothetical protein